MSPNRSKRNQRATRKIYTIPHPPIGSSISHHRHRGLCALARSLTHYIPKIYAHCSTQYSYIEFTYARSALEAVNWRREHNMDNITEGQKGLLQYGCGYSADPCVQARVSSRKYASSNLQFVYLMTLVADNDVFCLFTHTAQLIFHILVPKHEQHKSF